MINKCISKYNMSLFILDLSMIEQEILEIDCFRLQST